ncbi:MAG: methylmalonyl Co-A mutase-associated GTPase MeaB, partial [Rhodothermales bacterium]|nr:methylmalonyl Co-A mutase-associated GTPase MeaB [Rhodothermales bacterium]
MPGSRHIDSLYHEIRRGNRSALGRGLTLIESTSAGDESDRTRLLELASAESRAPASANRIAVTGVPGSGKSTLIDGLGAALLNSGRRVAVLAVDPSSDRTGGSILGDKTRMQRLAASDDAFVRPSPTRGHSGGIAATTRESIVLLEAAGYDTTIIETVGVGQSETGVSAVADLVLLVLLGGAGDSLQGIKRGILEIADLIVINKADGENTDAAKRSATELRRALHILRPESNHPRFVRSFSAFDQDDIDALANDMRDMMAELRTSGRLARSRASQRVDWFESAIDELLRRRIRAHRNFDAARERLSEAVREGSVDPALAA